jgi:hypothetical protein
MGNGFEITIAGTVVARVGLTDAAAADLEAANASAPTLISDHRGSELAPPALGNDTIDPRDLPNTVGFLGAATVFAGNAGLSFMADASWDRLAAGDTTIIGGGAPILGASGDTALPSGLDSFLAGSHPHMMGVASIFQLGAGDHGASPPIPAPNPDSLHLAGVDSTTVSGGGGGTILQLADGTTITLRGFPNLER